MYSRSCCTIISHPKLWSFLTETKAPLMKMPSTKGKLNSSSSERRTQGRLGLGSEFNLVLIGNQGPVSNEFHDLRIGSHLRVYTGWNWHGAKVVGVL